MLGGRGGRNYVYPRRAPGIQSMGVQKSRRQSLGSLIWKEVVKVARWRGCVIRQSGGQMRAEHQAWKLQRGQPFIWLCILAYYDLHMGSCMKIRLFETRNSLFAEKRWLSNLYALRVLSFSSQTGPKALTTPSSSNQIAVSARH